MKEIKAFLMLVAILLTLCAIAYIGAAMGIH